MFSNRMRRRGISMFLLFSILMMTSCSFGKGNIGEVGTDLSVETDKNQYLDTKNLENANKEYKIYEVQYGTYSDAVKEINVSEDYYMMKPIRADVEAGALKVIGIEFHAGYVQEGAVLLWVEPLIDEQDILETELKLERLRGQYERARQDYEMLLQEKKKQISTLAYAYEAKAENIRLEREALEWENTARTYEEQIQNTDEQLEKLKKQIGITQILMPELGYVLYEDATGALYGSDIRIGDIIRDGDIICYTSVPITSDVYDVWAEPGKYNYGNTMSLIGSNSLTEKTMPVKMISGGVELYGNLKSEEVQFAIQYVDDEQLQAEGDVGYSYTRLYLEGNLNTMENVLLVPVKAVTNENGNLYVTVVKPDGSLLKTGFVAGGNNSEYYWVLDGLKAGTQILLGE